MLLYTWSTVFTTLRLTDGYDGHGGHEARHPLAGVGQLAQPLGVLLERPLVASKRHNLCHQPPLEEEALLTQYFTRATTFPYV